MVWMILYIIGALALASFITCKMIEKEDVLLVDDIPWIIMGSMFSWIGIIALLFYCYGDVVIYKKKQEED